MQVWPLVAAMNPEGWLSNFSGPDEQIAIGLLDAFLFVSELLVRAHLIAAFQQISVEEVGTESDLDTASRLWRSFCSSVVLVPVEGEHPSPAESGHVIGRLARDVLGVPEANILPAADALYVLKGGLARPVVFVDDLSGTGLQFRDFWRRSYRLVDSTALSFQQLQMTGGGPFYFAPLLITGGALTQLANTAPSVRVRPAHVLGPEYYARSMNSILWVAGGAEAGRNFLVRQATRLGHDHADDMNLFGFGGMGLAVSFAHGTPDHTLPVFSWRSDGFIPLFDRRSE